MFEDTPRSSERPHFEQSSLFLCYNDDSKLNFPIENLAMFVILSLNYNPQRRSADPPTMRCFGLSSSQARLESTREGAFLPSFSAPCRIALPPN